MGVNDDLAKLLQAHGLDTPAPQEAAGDSEGIITDIGVEDSSVKYGPDGVSGGKSGWNYYAVIRKGDEVLAQIRNATRMELRRWLRNNRYS